MLIDRGNYKLYKGDCLEVMDGLIKLGVKFDAIITDPPYGTTQNKWDSVIPLDKIWSRINKLIKPNGAIVLFGSEPFTSLLIRSNLKDFKYNWIWQKNKSTGFLNSKKQPLNDHEIISVFYKKQCVYNPQMTKAEKIYNRGYVVRNKDEGIQQSDNYGEQKSFMQVDTGLRYPKRIQYFNNNFTKQQLHPTQKPIDLLEYLIKTYTNEGDLVLDFTMGSGSTGVACINTNRRFVGIELDEKYFNISSKRLSEIS
ncbi:TPA: site-specific DNA-methyltransferase [Clostridioides difficile]|uniref:DNA-methyltransferase n=1 Tax=Clostridioides difficile TaxID=1496 RepID=UPI00097FE384|nr:site-specific DNA-methyltransferase [Clostridioides difficile]EGT5564419.1 site-specific DNA-methyltransferase [Clostridioides difficile]MBY1346480.1 site-specific DNA-methyltransferase [Clostridioides difficile]MBY2783143.1 site-specific DNA-methyltransferase [Clostridioides difficile]SJU79004.1 Modification methylase DpnIIB [Clostridioides difficile]HBE8132656.1 site-specific DNA-methyltransferase [Clostridioides difficile]